MGILLKRDDRNLLLIILLIFIAFLRLNDPILYISFNSAINKYFIDVHHHLHQIKKVSP